MSKTPLLLPAAPEEYERLAAIGHDAFAADKQRYGQGPDIYENPAFLLPLLQRGGTVYKLVVGDEIIGVVLCFQKEPGVRRLGCLALPPAWQGQGYGTLAIRLLEQKYPDTICWQLDTPADKTKNLRFYQKNGYRVTGETQTPDGMKLALLEKRL